MTTPHVPLRAVIGQGHNSGGGPVDRLECGHTFDTLHERPARRRRCYFCSVALARGEVAMDAVVEYAHPSWGRSRGRVLRVGGEHGDDKSMALVQDLHKHGAREWWPMDQIRRVE